MVFILRASSHKSQTPLKESTCANADMTFTRPFGMGVLDGVGGMSEFGLDPADLARELRDSLRFHLNSRNYPGSFHGPIKKSKWDDIIRQRLQAPYKAIPARGDWLKNLVGISLSACSLPGSVVIGLVSMLGTKLSYFILGDIRLYVFRFCHVAQYWYTPFKTQPQRDTVLPDGRLMPNQAYMPDAWSFENLPYIRKLMDTAEIGRWIVQEGDVVLLCTDGVWENLPGNQLLQVMQELLSNNDPNEIARGIVESAKKINRKEDDVSCAVGIVTLCR